VESLFVIVLARKGLVLKIFAFLSIANESLVSEITPAKISMTLLEICLRILLFLRPRLRL
jgi:hypothetical protein